MSEETKKEVKGEVTLTFQVPANNVFNLKKKKEILQKFSRLDMADQQRIEELISNPTALKKLKENWDFLKSFIS